MFAFLKDHPFAVEAFFERSIVLTFATSREELEQFIPKCLTLDTFKNKWAFLAVALVQTTNLRPKGFPKLAGNDFFLIGYRVFVRYVNRQSRKLRGLYILKSQTDKKRMEVFGNIFTHYNYETTDIQQSESKNKFEIKSVQSGLKIQLKLHEGEVQLPEKSPFSNWVEARRFSGPLPFTFTYNPENKTVLLIEGVRKNWNPYPVKVSSYEIAFLNSLKLSELRLANAFAVDKTPYYWKKGKVEKWNG